VKAVMETSRGSTALREPGKVRAGTPSFTENPSGAAD